MKNHVQTGFACLCLAIFLTACNGNASQTAETPEATTLQPAEGNAVVASIVPEIPEAIKVLAEDVLVFTVYAEGVQIYECQTNEKGQLEWKFLGPEAELRDEKGNPIGTHGSGPFWELAADGSKVVGDPKMVKKDGVERADDIPWLLLENVKSNGYGVLRGVTKIHRVSTKGGKAPADGCDKANAGKVVRVPYTATYYFYAGK
ncbi:MAG: DUF3455 domain-containing protein [Saprospiraceae bacterium]